MSGLDGLETLCGLGVLFQILLIAHFAVRKWRFRLARRYGWIVYAMGIPAAVVIVLLLHLPDR